jgi:hypothetical protein
MSAGFAATPVRELVLPSNVEAERSLLGGMLLDNTLYAEAAALTPGDFSLDAHRRIFARVLAMAAAGQPIDFVTLSEELGRHQELESVGGRAYLSSLTDGAPRRTSIEHYVHIVHQKAILRAVVHQAEAVQYAACEPGADVAALAERLAAAAQQSRKNLSASSSIRTLADVPDVYSCDASAVLYVVEDLLPRAAVTLLTGAPGVGKSWLALRLAICCCLGVEFLGRNSERIEILYLDRENPLSLVRQRMDASAGGPVPGLHIWGNWLPDEPPVLGDPRLLAFAETEQPLIIFDSLVRFHSVDENAASEMRVVMGHLRRLADAGASVLVLHHRSKSEGNKYRGSSDILAAVDVAYSLEHVDGLLQLHRFKSRFAPEATFTLRADLSRGAFELTDSPTALERETGLEAIRDFIDSHPGASQRNICEAVEPAGVYRAKALELLRKETGHFWRTEPGERRSIKYFPVSMTMSVPSVPAYKAAEHRNTTVPTVRECSGTLGTLGTVKEGELQ